MILVCMPDWSTRIAGFFGIGRGVDFVSYLSQILIYFLIVLLYVRLQELNANVTKLARHVALLKSTDVEKK
jgi:hypothetical protein